MIKIKHIAFLLVFTGAITLFFACKKTPDRPPVKTTTIGGTLTIAELRALFVGNNIKFTQDVSLFATVTMTDNYKTLYIRDQTGAISLKQLTAHGIYAGDSLRINLNGSTLDLTGSLGSLQIDSVDVSSSPTNKVVKLAVGKNPTPITLSIAQLGASSSNVIFNTNVGSVTMPQSIYDGQLVAINDVQFAYTDSGNYIPLNTASVYLNHPLFDCGAYNSITVSLYAGTTDFLYQKVPHTKSGSIIGAISFYNGALQLTPRSFADVKFNQSRCGVDTLTQSFNNPNWGSNVAFYSVSASMFPGWLDINQIGTSITWEGGSNGLIVFPYASTYGSANPRNVTWVISPPIQYSPTKKINFQAATDFNTNQINQLSVLISTDFNGINMGPPNYPTAHPAHWTDITSSFPGIPLTGTYSFNFASGSINPILLSSTSASVLFSAGYTGTFYIGFRYTGNLVDSTATYAISNVTIRD